jgi:hypothetical protein
MFSLCLKLLTIVTFTGHVMLGCCAHHVHGTEVVASDDSITVVVEHKHAHSNCSHHHSSIESTDNSADDQPSDHPEHHGDCDEVECSYVESNDTVTLVDISSWPLCDLENVLVTSSPVAVQNSTIGHDLPDISRLGSALESCAHLHRWQL